MNRTLLPKSLVKTGIHFSLITVLISLAVTGTTRADILRAEMLRYLQTPGRLPEPAPAHAKWCELEAAPKSGVSITLGPATVAEVDYVVMTFGYGIYIRFTPLGIRELRDAPADRDLTWVAGGMSLSRSGPGSHAMPEEIIWVEGNMGVQEFHLEDAKQVVEAIKGTLKQIKIVKRDAPKVLPAGPPKNVKLKGFVINATTTALEGGRWEFSPNGVPAVQGTVEFKNAEGWNQAILINKCAIAKPVGRANCLKLFNEKAGEEKPALLIQITNRPDQWKNEGCAFEILAFDPPR